MSDTGICRKKVASEKLICIASLILSKLIARQGIKEKFVNKLGKTG